MKVFFSLVLLSSSLIFAEKLYSNLTEEEILRLDKISENIRCPKCDYGNINSSNAPISKDLKKEISYLISNGKSDKEIYDLMRERYGNYIILNEEIGKNNLLIYLPLIVLILSIGLVTIYTIKKRNET